MTSPRALAFIAALSLALTACGQTGALYLPQTPPESQTEEQIERSEEEQGDIENTIEPLP